MTITTVLRGFIPAPKVQVLLQRLFTRVDNSPLIVFRIVFGFLLIAESWTALNSGWVTNAFITPKITFPFIFFSWLHPLPGDGMYYYYMVMGLLGLMIMVGWQYRLAIVSYTILWAGAYFMQKTNYNNHYYLLLLLLVIMCIVPANGYASLDARRNLKIRSLSCPQWVLWLFVAQIAIVYMYAAISKMYPDWIQLKPISEWFKTKASLPVIGGLLQEKWFQYFVAFGGLAYDSLIVPALLWQKSRRWAFAASIFFHLFNSFVFRVGIFPYLGISWALFFFAPETIRKTFLKNKPAFEHSEEEVKSTLAFNQKLLAYGLGLYVSIQMVIPLRHWFYEGDVHWTEEGHRMSWQMMTRNKRGTVSLYAYDPDSDKTWLIDMSRSLTPKQMAKVAIFPDMCWQYVQMLKKDFSRHGFPDIEIYADGLVQLNGDKWTQLYNPQVDLTKVEWSSFKHSDWLLPRNNDKKLPLPDNFAKSEN